MKAGDGAVKVLSEEVDAMKTNQDFICLCNFISKVFRSQITVDLLYEATTT
jgi:hypothetical protein